MILHSQDSTTKAALLASKEVQLNQVNTLAKFLDDEKQRALKILAAAKNINTATEGYHQVRASQSVECRREIDVIARKENEYDNSANKTEMIVYPRYHSIGAE